MDEIKALTISKLIRRKEQLESSINTLNEYGNDDGWQVRNFLKAVSFSINSRHLSLILDDLKQELSDTTDAIKQIQ